MSEDWRDIQEQSEGAGHIYEGRPNEITKTGERGHWKRFWSRVLPYLQAKWNLVERLAEAKVSQQEATAEKARAEARKFAAEAAEIAARKDSEQQNAVEKHFDLVNDLGIDEETAQALKLAKMIEANPVIAEQIEKVGDTIERLRIVHGVSVGLVKGALPMPPDSATSDSAAGEGE